MVELLLEGTWVDITKQVKSVITYDKRVDEVFDTGTFSFESQAITYNIPPLTLCRIDDQYWFASSECNTIIPTAYYNHNVELLELTYIAHTVIIGTKAFSNRGAYKTHNDKIQILVELATSKNQLLFGVEADAYEIEPFIDSKNIEREFTFGAGTSLFIALLEIGKTVDAIPRITGFKKGIIGNTIWHIAWDYLDYNNTFIIDRNRLIQEKQFQDVENYTAMLEAEMQNVVDRDTIVEVKNLTVRSEDFYINSDNQVLLLPSKAEEIVDFRLVYDTLPMNVTIEFLPSVGWGEGLILDNYYTWVELYYNEKTTEIMNYLRNKLEYLGYPFSPQLRVTFQTKVGTGYRQFFIDYATQTDVIGNIGVSAMPILLEKTEWGLLDVSEQPKYFVYESGSNKIDNLFASYKKDLWNTILDTSSEGAIKSRNWNYTEDDFVIEGEEEKHFKFEIYGNGLYSNAKYYNPVKGVKFNVKYKPIVDTYIKSTNTKRPYNETKIKNTSRSFEASASVSDFNLLQNSINKSNEMLGMPEITLTYVGSEIPAPANLIVYKDKNYYVSSVQTTINLGKYTSYINLVSSYSKVAEVFGVASQFESTKNPLNGIVDRYVYCGRYNNEMNYNITGIRLGYTDSNGDTQYVYKRGAFVSYEGTTYYVVSANDQYTFETGMVANSKLKGDNFENKQYPYSDLNNEQVNYYVGLAIENDNLTFEQSKDLPSLPYIYFDNVLTNSVIKTYKDARERLIFCYEIV